MIIEGIIENLAASAIGAFFLYGASKLLHDWFYIGFRIPEKTEEGEKEKKRVIKLYRRFPWRHAYKYAKNTAETMKNGTAEELYDPTIIVGIGRGGAIYGSIFSYYMKETPLLALDRRYLFDEQGKRIGEDWYHPIDIPKELLQKVLLVAGEYHSGKTMQQFKQRLIGIGAKEIRTCVLYYQTGLPNQVGIPDYYGITSKYDYLMPWQEKQFLRTWKESNDAKVREFTLKSVEMEGLKEGFFLMRHAQTDANAEDRFIGSGSPNEGITAKGRLEARNVGNFLKETVGELDLIYCSPIRRCLETAREIQSVAGGMIEENEKLIEANYGAWEGVKRSDIPKGDYEKYVKDQKYMIPDSTDTYSTIQERANSFLEEMLQSPTTHGKRVLVVTHKSIGRIMVQSIEKKEHQHFRTIPMENASLRKIVVKDKTMTIPYYIKVLDGEIVVK
jgi:probable phosphoglycerate mutase